MWEGKHTRAGTSLRIGNESLFVAAEQEGRKDYSLEKQSSIVLFFGEAMWEVAFEDLAAAAGLNEPGPFFFGQTKVEAGKAVVTNYSREWMKRQAESSKQILRRVSQRSE